MTIAADILTRNIHVLLIENIHDLVKTTVTVFSQKGSQINPVSNESYGQISQAIKKIPQHSDVILVISGDDILTRYGESLDKNFFLEIDEEDFDMQKNQSKSGIEVQAVCRKAYISEIIKQVNSQKYFLLDIIYAEVAALSLEEILIEGILQVGSIEYAFTKNGKSAISEYQDFLMSYDQYRIADEILNRTELVSLASVVYYQQGRKPDNKQLRFQAEQSRYFKKYSRTGILSLSSIFLLLLVNFLFYNHSKKELGRLKIETQDKILANNQIETLQSQLSEFNRLSQTGRSLNDNKYSYYLDRLGILRPVGLWFNALDIYPLMKKQSSNDRIEVYQDIIKLSGEVNAPSVLNQFIKSMKSESWVKNIELNSYSAVIDSNKAEFTIEISI